MATKSHQPIKVATDQAQLLRITCKCGAKLKVKAKGVERRLPCPKCDQMILVRADPSAGGARRGIRSTPVPDNARTPESRIADALSAKPVRKQEPRQSTPPSLDLHKTSNAIPAQATVPPISEYQQEGDGDGWRSATETSPSAPGEPHQGNQASGGSAAKPPADESRETAEAVLPWETRLEVLEKAQAYRENQRGIAFLCKCNEFLNGISKKETMRDAVLESELLVCDDLAMIDGRMSWFEALVQWLIAKLGVGALFILWPIQLISLFCNPFSLVGLALDLMVFGVLATILMWIVTTYWLYSLLAAVIASGAFYAYQKWSEQRLATTLVRIKENPLSSFSIRKMFTYTPLIPRVWERGTIVQLVRLNTRYRLRKRSLLLMVQDNPLPKRSFWSTGLGLVISRWFWGLRRVYVVSFDNGPDAADEAAAAAARLFQVPIEQATFFGGALRMAK